MPTTMKMIAKQTLANSTTATVTFAGIPQSFTDLLIVTSSRTTDTGQNWANVLIRPNAATTNLSQRVVYGTGAAAASASYSVIYYWAASDACTASTFGNAHIYIPNYAGSTNKSLSIESVSESNATGALAVAGAGLWSSTTAISSVDLVADSTFNFVSGSSFFLYGITKA